MNLRSKKRLPQDKLIASNRNFGFTEQSTRIAMLSLYQQGKVYLTDDGLVGKIRSSQQAAHSKI